MTARRMMLGLILSIVVAIPITMSAHAGVARGKPPPPPPPPLTNPALAYAADGSLFLTSADGSVTRQLTSTGRDRQPVWHPAQANVIGFVRRGPSSNCGDLYTIAADGTSQTLVHDFYTPYINSGGTTPCPDSVESEWDWSPDGTQMAFVSGSGPAHGFYILDIATGNVQGFAAFPTPSSGLSWSPDGGKIAYHAWVDDVTGDDILLVDLATGSVNNLTPWPSAQRTPSWSTDGQHIAYWGDDNPRPLMIMNADGTGAQEVVSFAGSFPVNRPVWSPDDSYIAFHMPVVVKRTSSFELVRVRLDGTGLVNLTNSARTQEKQPDWNPAWVNHLD